jgi:hypothetical protein
MAMSTQDRCADRRQAAEDCRQDRPALPARRPFGGEDQATSRRFWASASDCSFLSDWFSIWRMRSRVTGTCCRRSFPVCRARWLRPLRPEVCLRKGNSEFQHVTAAIARRGELASHGQTSLIHTSRARSTTSWSRSRRSTTTSTRTGSTATRAPRSPPASRSDQLAISPPSCASGGSVASGPADGEVVARLAQIGEQASINPQPGDSSISINLDSERCLTRCRDPKCCKSKRKVCRNWWISQRYTFAKSVETDALCGVA